MSERSISDEDEDDASCRRRPRSLYAKTLNLLALIGPPLAPALLRLIDATSRSRFTRCVSASTRWPSARRSGPGSAWRQHLKRKDSRRSYLCQEPRIHFRRDCPWPEPRHNWDSQLRDELPTLPGRRSG